MWLVDSPVFHESQRLHSFVIDCVFAGVGSCFKKCLKCHHSKVVWQLGEQIWLQQRDKQIDSDFNQPFDDTVSFAATSLRSKQARHKLQEKLAVDWLPIAQNVMGCGIGSSVKKMDKLSCLSKQMTCNGSMADHISKQIEVLITAFVNFIEHGTP